MNRRSLFQIMGAGSLLAVRAGQPATGSASSRQQSVLARHRNLFKSFAVHEEFEDHGAKDRRRITSAADKQFASLDDFKSNAEQVFEREAVAN